MFRWLFLLVAAGALNAQSVPHLQNPGFEPLVMRDKYRDGKSQAARMRRAS